MLTYTQNVGTIVRIPRVIWVLRGPTTVVVDTSVAAGQRAAEFIGEDFTRSKDQEPANALAAAGVDPRDVETVVLTHLHWDHAGNCDLFPDARVVVQQQELRYAISPGRFFRKSFLAPQSGWGIPPYLVPNLETVDGARELHPGLRVIPVPGHTPGSQGVVVDTAHGSFCIGGDAVLSYENFEQDIPPGFHVNVDDSMESYDRIRETADHVLPSHDYEVFLDGAITEIGAKHTMRGTQADQTRG
jgi:glyoxylase-like metal-dependent hydrolase (beta-lactamase superfamily II)